MILMWNAFVYFMLLLRDVSRKNAVEFGLWDVFKWLVFYNKLQIVSPYCSETGEMRQIMAFEKLKQGILQHLNHQNIAKYLFGH